jgi:hypothetical protein
MDNIQELKAQAFDARIKLDQFEGQIQQFMTDHVNPAKAEYQKLVNTLAEALKEEQANSTKE